MNDANRFANVGVVSKEIATGVSGLEFLKGLRNQVYPTPPFAETTEIWIAEVESGHIVFEASPSARFYNPMGTVHGGWISTVLDSAMGCAVHSLLKPGQAFTSVELKVNFVRPLFEQTGKLRCEGKIVHLGGRLATSEGRLTDLSGNLIAHGSTTCMILTM